MNLIIACATIVVFLTLSSGLYLVRSPRKTSKKQLKRALGVNVASFAPLLVMGLVLLVPDAVLAAGGQADGLATGLGYIGAALATGMATIGSGYAVGVCGSAALGAVSEDQSVLGKTLIFVGLAEGIAIYGLIISIMIIGRL